MKEQSVPSTVEGAVEISMDVTGMAMQDKVERGNPIWERVGAVSK